MSWRFATVTMLASVVGIAGCRTTPFNSDPTCRPCSEYLSGQTLSCPADSADPDTPHPSMPWPYRNLVLEGGGVKGAAYAGAFDVLSKRGLLNSFEKVGGTSAGAITALLLSLGYSAEEIQSITLGTDFAKFEDGSTLGNADRLIERYGWYKGDYALCLLRCVVGKKLCPDGASPPCDGEATFADLERATKRLGGGFRPLTVLGTNLDTRSSKVFSAECTPDAKLADVVRISMSIPLFFAAREYEDQIYVDGGVLDNYPIEIFDGGDKCTVSAEAKTSSNPETLGLHLGGQPAGGEVRDVVEYSESLVETILDQQLDALCLGPTEIINRTVFIDPLDIGTTDFDLSMEDKCRLVNSGKKNTRLFLEEAWDECPVWAKELRPLRGRSK